MRELLFRGFHPCDGPEIIVVDGEKVKGKWVEGYIVKHRRKIGALGANITAQSTAHPRKAQDVPLFAGQWSWAH